MIRILMTMFVVYLVGCDSAQMQHRSPVIIGTPVMEQHYQRHNVQPN